MVNKVIGLTGPIGSGKSTVASMMVDQGLLELAFATPVKIGLSKMLGIPLSLFEDRDFKELIIEGLGVSPRDLMISLGHDWGRNAINGSLWIKILERELKQHCFVDNNIVISDVRYADEADFVRKYGTLVHIDRPDIIRRDHESEAGVEFMPGDLAIVNHGSLDELREQVLWLTGTATGTLTGTVSQTVSVCSGALA